MYRIGIDLGGTNIKAGLVDEQFRIISERCIATNVNSGEHAIIQNIANLAKEMVQEQALTMEDILGIGIGSPGAIDQKKGVVIYSNNFFWENVPFLNILASYLDCPAFIANDAQCAALGEVMAGAGRGCSNLIMVTLGTGVGGGIIIDGKVFDGGGGGGIIGHTVIVRHGEHCTCGRDGCFESYASATALIRETRNALRCAPNSILADLCHGNPDWITGKTVFDAANMGDPLSTQIVQEYVEVLGDGIANLINIFRPEKVLISGGVCNQGDDLLRPLNRHIQKNCFAGSRLFIPRVDRAMLGTKAGTIGAAALVPERNENGN